MSLTKTAVRLIHQSLDKLFNRLQQRVLSHKFTQEKQLVIGYKPRLTLDSIFTAAAKDQGVEPDEDALSVLIRTAEGYIDAVRSRTKSRVVNAVDAWLKKAAKEGVETDVETVLGGELADVYGESANHIKRILETEGTHAVNAGALDGIVKINAYQGIADPVVYFSGVLDTKTCEPCKRLHWLNDSTIPRVWKLSSLHHGYGKRDDEVPTSQSRHPNCRCLMSTLLPGFGFTDDGKVTYISPGHDEWEKQRNQ